MRQAAMLLCAAALAAGCQNAPQPAFDPFVGRSTVTPPEMYAAPPAGNGQYYDPAGAGVPAGTMPGQSPVDPRYQPQPFPQSGAPAAGGYQMPAAPNYGAPPTSGYHPHGASYQLPGLPNVPNVRPRSPGVLSWPAGPQYATTTTGWAPRLSMATGQPTLATAVGPGEVPQEATAELPTMGGRGASTTLDISDVVQS